MVRLTELFQPRRVRYNGRMLSILHNLNQAILALRGYSPNSVVSAAHGGLFLFAWGAP